MITTRTVEFDMTNSTKQWETIVWPRLGPMIGGGRYFALEGVKSPLPEALDMQCGIDGIQIPRVGEPVGWATRVQKCEHDRRGVLQGWDTFTIRSVRDSGAKTELEKRIADTLDCDRTEGPRPLRSSLTGYAYIGPSGEFLSCAVVDTLDFNRFLRYGPDHLRKNRTDNAGFVILSWQMLKLNFVEVLGYRPRVFLIGHSNGSWEMPFGQGFNALWEAYR